MNDGLYEALLSSNEDLWLAFENLSRAYLALCAGETDVDAGIEVICQYLKVADDGFYLEEED